MNNRIVISFQLVKASVHVLRRNGDLLIYPIISAFGMLLVMAVFAGSIFAINELEGDTVVIGSRAFKFAAIFLFYFVTYTVIFFANTALIGAVMIMLDGGQPSVGDGFRIARDRVRHILGYALIMATVGMIFRFIFQFFGFTGRIVGPTIRRLVLGSIFGLAWGLVTYLVIPVLVMEGVGPLDALKTSTRLLKKTWGEQIAGNMSIWLLFSFPIILVIIAGYPLTSLAVRNLSEAYTIMVVYLYVMVVMTLFLVKSTLDAIFSAVVYRYAVEGLSAEGFDEELLNNAFRRSSGGLAGRARNMIRRRNPASVSGSETMVQTGPCEVDPNGKAGNR